MNRLFLQFLLIRLFGSFLFFLKNSTNSQKNQSESEDFKKQYYLVVRTPAESNRLPVIIEPLKTDMPYYLDFFTGAETMLKSTDGESKNFSDAFSHIGLRISNRFNENWRSFANFRLVTVGIETEKTVTKEGVASTEKSLSPEKSYDVNGGIAYRLHTFSFFSPSNKIDLGLALKLGGQTSETNQSFLIKEFIGIRLLNTGVSFNSAYLDLGYGRSDNFYDGRWKFEGFLPLNLLGIDAFLLSNIETADSGDNPPLVTIAAGVSVKPDRILDIIKK